MIVYLSGKITGNPIAEAEFGAQKEKLVKHGHVVLNPAELPHGMLPGDYMRICLSMIDVADLVMMLDNWQSSPGAKLEKAYCEYIGKPCVGYMNL